MKECLFCKIGKHEISSEIEFENNKLIAFADINPKAPVHILIVPKKHIETIDHLDIGDENLVGEMVYTAQRIARDKKIADNGYRLVFNVKKHGGQIVGHIHLHLLGGQKLREML